MRPIFVALALVAARAPASRAACPCLSSTVSQAALSDSISDGTLEYAGEEYPVTYGADTCARHDQDLPPYCADDDGIAKNNPPEFCADEWCWVDPDNCDLSIIQESSYFPQSGLHFSYQACGSANSFSSWFEGTGSDRSLDEVADLVESYTYTIRDEVESEYSSLKGSSCKVPGCGCGDCEELPDDAWGGEGVDLSSTIFKEDSGQDATDLSKCIANVASSVFSRVASKEYVNTTRVGYLYAGMQVDGTYVQWPGQDWCSDFDPRFRPWYAAAATGPKNVVIVVDVSRSMEDSGRIELAREATAAIADTLTWKDRAALITFNDEARVVSIGGDAANLAPVTDAVRDQVKTAAEGMVPGGGTDFYKPLDAALTMLEEAETLACESVILFLTDGKAAFSQQQMNEVRDRAKALGSTSVLTYALGADADVTATRGIACTAAGVFHRVPDGGDLAAAMSAYYSFLAAGSSYSGARWVLYKDAVLGGDLLAACTVFTDPAANVTGVRRLAGVACMDVNVVVDLEVLRNRDDYDEFISEVEKRSEKCPEKGLFHGLEGDELETALQTVRLRLASAGAEVCPGPGETSLGVAAVAGIAVGSCAVCLLCGAGAFFFHRRRKRMREQSKERSPQQPAEDAPGQPPAYTASAPPQSAYYAIGAAPQSAYAIAVAQPADGGSRPWMPSTQAPRQAQAVPVVQGRVI